MKSVLSMAYMCMARASCLLLFRQAVRLAFSFALARAGRSRPARIAMMAITTRSSIRVNAGRQTPRHRTTRHGPGLNVFTLSEILSAPDMGGQVGHVLGLGDILQTPPPRGQA